MTKIRDIVVSLGVSIILSEIGLMKIIEKDFILGVLIITLAILIVSFTFNTSQIKENTEKLKELENEKEFLKRELETQQKLLNTLSTIKILNSLRRK